MRSLKTVSIDTRFRPHKFTPPEYDVNVIRFAGLPGLAALDYALVKEFATSTPVRPPPANATPTDTTHDLCAAW